MKALALISGGLDSILSAKLIQEQGIQIIPVYFRIPFCHRGKNISSAKERLSSLSRNSLKEELKVYDIADDFMKIIIDPEHGFGSQMNPCIDCKILMLMKAKQLMQEYSACFVITGEVLGQRPMSQHRKALLHIAEKSQLEGLVLRPLSAGLLPETIPEEKEWVKRSELLSFSGRGRKPQFALADRFKISGFGQPAGGCLLTDPQFSLRLKELIAHKELGLDNAELLKFGRHFRLGQNAKLIVGRNEEEDKILERLAGPGDHLFLPAPQVAGPSSLGKGSFTEELIYLSCRITSRYCDNNRDNAADLIHRHIPKKGPVLEFEMPHIPALEEDELLKIRI